MDLIGPTSHFYLSQRLRLHYVDWGNAEDPTIVLVHGGRDHARDTDTVAAHEGGYRFTLHIEDAGLHGLRILLAELEDMTDLDSAQNPQLSLAIRTWITVDNIAQIDANRFIAIPTPVDVLQVLVILVRATDEVAHCGRTVIDVAFDRQSHRSN